jgi:glycosyltransferase involved in cell wall biosynthesis
LTQPDISIITVCRNARHSIERAIGSVINCAYRNFEYVVVDGNSTDGTQEIIERHRSHIHKYVSEPDAGISDALNKAVGMSEGRFHIIVHADDELLPGGLARLAERAAAIDAAVVSGSVLVMNEGRVVREFRPQPQKLRQKMSVPHMGSLIAKSAWQAAHGYDVRRKLAMDHLLMLRILREAGLGAFAVVDQAVARYFMGGASYLQMDRGFREVRDNLLETGAGAVTANLAYLQLLARSRLARLLGRQ